MGKRYLTEAMAKNEPRPQKGRKELSDAEPGLFLWITKNGTRTWVVIYRLDDGSGARTARRKKAIGRYPGVGITQARERAREVMAMAADGVDPDLREKEEQAAAERDVAESDAGTFRAVAESYVAAMKVGQLVGGRKRPVTQTTATARERLLAQRVFPDLGNRPLSEVTTPMLAHLLTRLEKEGGPVDETLKVIRGTFNFALARGLFHGAVPTAGMTNRQPPKKVTRSLTSAELKDIWSACGQQGWPFGSIIRLLMLTGQRKTEIAAMRWQEVDWDRKLLILPAKRVKNRAGAHEVPLSEPALAILKEALAACEALARPNDEREGVLPTDLVFPSDTGETSISGWNKLKAKLDRIVKGNRAGVTDEEWELVLGRGFARKDFQPVKEQALAKIESAALEPWRIHDLRHTFITRCRDGEENAEGEVIWSAPLDVLQATVNHKLTAGVTATYDHGDLQRRYRLRKRELLDWWARKLMLIVGEAEPQDNIVQKPVRAG